ncbi:hypothetical protein STAQ_43500 [Allostella sp. ATCC 35155]|nr:hypothetical protein STAQ_43500 [Stella sp. ATCC 35155]
MPRPSTLRERFADDGFVGPEAVLTVPQCALLLRHEAVGSCPPPLDWNKGRAATDPLFADIARTPAILRLLRPLLGDDVVLWGASIVRRGPGDVHTWHTDIETSTPTGRFVSVWIGLENTSAASGLTLIGGSHRLPRTIQEELHRRGLRRSEVDDDAVLAIAREMDPGATLAIPPTGDGLAILFHGRTWHGSRNLRGGLPRSALLLQYAAAATPVRILDSSRLEWPFAFLDEPRPPVLAVLGEGDAQANRVVPPPGRAGTLPPERVFPLTLPLPRPPAAAWHPHALLSGRAPNLPAFTCHASVLAPGHQPHLPHSHIEEEILVVLEGEAELAIAHAPEDPAPRRIAAHAGHVAYYPAYQHHTIRNVGPGPLSYAMIKWSGPAAAVETALGLQSAADPGAAAAPGSDRVAIRPIFEGPTQFLGKLHAHRTTIRPGGGYPAHVDPHDIVIFVLSGRVRTLGREVGAGAVLFHPAGEPHGMENPGSEPARYVVFEFHAPDPATIPALVDADWYRARYPDVAAAGIDPLTHYLRFGAREGRLPRPPTPAALVDADLLDPAWYLARYPDVAASGQDPVQHYRYFGAAEGRDPCPEPVLRLAERSGLFDADWYRREHPGEAGPVEALLRAYLADPALRQRALGPRFHGARYLAENPDVDAAGLNPLAHYLRHGRHEGRALPICEDWKPPPDLEQRVAHYRARSPGGQPRIALCTAIVGGYKTLMVPDRPDPAVDYLCFSDRPIDGYGVWDVRTIPFRHDDPVRVARFAKTHIAKLAEGYETVAWIDGNVLLRGSPLSYADRMEAAGWGVGLVVHPERACIFAEAEACKAQMRDDPATIDAQMAAIVRSASRRTPAYGRPTSSSSVRARPAYAPRSICGGTRSRAIAVATSFPWASRSHARAPFMAPCCRPGNPCATTPTSAISTMRSAGE